MGKEQLSFATYCVGILSDATGTDEPKMFSLLDKTGVMCDYIIPCYNVLHTFGKDYLVQELLSVLRKKGAEV